MKASDLRIGNLVQSYADIITVEYVDKLLLKGFFHRDIIYNTSIQIKHCKPIPLTEEWLVKLGFTRHHADYSNNVIYIKNVPDNTEFEWGVYPNELGSGIQIQNRKLLKYVHQLQNLYHALTGEELTIKDEVY